jgi:hypothetical protein
MPRLGGRQFHRRVQGERIAELLAALAFTLGSAIDEGQVLVRFYALLACKTTFDRELQVPRGISVVALVVLVEAGRKRFLPRAERLEDFRQAVAGATAKDDREGYADRKAEHLCNLRPCKNPAAVSASLRLIFQLYNQAVEQDK